MALFFFAHFNGNLHLGWLLRTKEWWVCRVKRMTCRLKYVTNRYHVKLTDSKKVLDKQYFYCYIHLETMVHTLKHKNLRGGVAEAELVTKLNGIGKASSFSFMMVDGF